MEYSDRGVFVNNIKTAFMFANYTPADKAIGITKKIGAEIRTLRKKGMAVTYTGYDGDGVSVFGNDDAVIFHKAYPFHWDKLNRKLRYYWLEKTALEYLKQAESFDLGYIRMGAPNRVFFSILKRLKDGGATLIGEAHAYFPGIKYKSLGGKYITWMYEMHKAKFKDYISCFIVEGSFPEMYGVKAYKTSIGVEVDAICPHQYSGDKQTLNLISVANEMSYHAYDRIVESLNAYLLKTDNRHIVVHLVGVISDETKALVEKYGLQEHVILYGKQSGAALDEIYNKCNVGLGPLGQHRVGGKKDTGLKTKEYFAKGLPYIYSGEEPTVPDGYPYICQFPSDESMIDFDRVWEFYKSYRDDPQVVEHMRAFAAEHYSWDTIMKEALSHLD